MIIYNRFIYRFKMASLVSLFFVSTIFLFGPTQLYLTNVVEFPFLYSELLIILVPIALLLFLFVTTVLISLPDRYSMYQRGISLLFVLSLLSWLQGNILVWNYGLLDGKDVQWSKHITKGLIDSSIWLTFVSLSLLKASIFHNVAKRASIFFILIQLFSAVYSIYNSPEIPSFQRYSIDETRKFQFSKERNVIILVLDTFQTDVFHEIINEDKKYKEVFDGFAYFRNAVGGFAKTYASVPLILTGRYYDNSIPIQEFIKKEYRHNSIPLILRNSYYQVDMYPYVSKTIYFDPKILSNLKEKELAENSEDIAYLYDVTLFRYTPHFIKRYIYNDQNWWIKKMFKKVVVANGGKSDRKVPGSWQEEAYRFVEDVQFIEKMTSESASETDRYIFKYYHLHGVHEPLLLNEDLKFERMPINRENFKRQAKASLKIAKMFLNKLKEMGVYDNSLILIMGDHGAGEYGIGVNVNLSGYQNKQSSISQSVKQAGIPLLLAKKINSRGEMHISDAPVSLSDIPATITAELGLKSDFPGRSIFALKESEKRERRFMYYQFDSFQSSYLQPLSEYVVSGFSWLDSSWKSTGNNFIPAKPKAYYGTLVEFGSSGNYLQYAKDGWGKGDSEVARIDGGQAELSIPYGLSGTDVIIIANLAPSSNAMPSRSMLGVSVNDEEVGQWDVKQDGKYSMLIPKDRVKEVMWLTFKLSLSDEASIVDKKNSELDIAFKTLQLIQVYRYGIDIDFARNGISQQYQTNGWSFSEPDFTWTNGKIASLSIPIEKADSDLTLTANLRPFLPAGKISQQQVKIVINGRNVKDWVINKNKFMEQSVIIPRDLTAEGVLNITFELPDANSPANLGLSNDSRTLGLAFRSIVIKD